MSGGTNRQLATCSVLRIRAEESSGRVTLAFPIPVISSRQLGVEAGQTYQHADYFCVDIIMTRADFLELFQRALNEAAETKLLNTIPRSFLVQQDDIETRTTEFRFLSHDCPHGEEKGLRISSLASKFGRTSRGHMTSPKPRAVRSFDIDGQEVRCDETDGGPGPGYG